MPLAFDRPTGASLSRAAKSARAVIADNFDTGRHGAGAPSSQRRHREKDMHHPRIFRSLTALEVGRIAGGLYEQREVSSDGGGEGAYSPSAGSLSTAFYVADAQKKESLLRWLAGVIGEYFLHRGLDEVVEGPAPEGQGVTHIWIEQTPDHSPGELGLNAFFYKISLDSPVVKTGDGQYSSIQISANGFDATAYHWVDRDGDQMPDALYMKESDGDWWVATSVDTLGQPQWRPTDKGPASDEGKEPKNQEG